MTGTKGNGQMFDEFIRQLWGLLCVSILCSGK
jgi:hypothetical protein